MSVARRARPLNQRHSREATCDRPRLRARGGPRLRAFARRRTRRGIRRGRDRPRPADQGRPARPVATRRHHRAAAARRRGPRRRRPHRRARADAGPRRSSADPGALSRRRGGPSRERLDAGSQHGHGRGNLLQRTRCPYFRDAMFACNKRAPGSGCPAIAGEHRAHAVFGGSDHCVAAHASDLAVALVALDAALELHGPGGPRRVPLREFYRLPAETPERETVLGRGELIVAVDVPGGPHTSALALPQGARPGLVRVRAGVGGGGAARRRRCRAHRARGGGRRRHGALAPPRRRGRARGRARNGRDLSSRRFASRPSAPARCPTMPSR